MVDHAVDHKPRDLISRLCKWRPRYSIRQEVRYTLEDKPYQETVDRLGDHHDFLDLFFLQGAEEFEWNSLRTAKLRSFMTSSETDAVLPQANAALGRYDSNFVAVLDQRARHDSSLRGNCSESSGLLTAVQLYNERNKNLPGKANLDALYAQHLLRRDGEELDITDAFRFSDHVPEADSERRLLYLPDPCRRVVSVLARTVNQKQAPALNQAIRNYLFRTPAIECRVRETFSLAAHLPIFAWRISKEPRTDQRQCDGESLREYKDVTFLTNPTCGREMPENRAFIYEAQSSFLVAGTDHWVWDAYGLIDTFYETEEDRKDTKYYEDRCHELPPGSRHDLIPAGNHLLDAPIWTPRAYFLMVFESRMTLQVVPEWTEVVDRLEAGIRTYTHDKEKGSDNKAHTTKWASDTIDVLTEVTNVLASTIESWDQFQSGAIGYFDDVEDEEHLTEYILGISHSFSKLRECRERLIDLQQNCRHFSQKPPIQFELQLRVEDNKIVSSQLKDAKISVAILIFTTVVRENHCASDCLKESLLILQLLTPTNMVAAIFNVPSIVPFPVNPINFGIANVVTAGLPDPEAPKPRRKKLLIEFASPNITTQSHGAHLRSAILGAHIAALYERMGWDVTRVNYLGDWGLQIGLLGAGWERFGNDDALGTDPLRHLLDVYSRIEAEFRPELEERARIRAAGGDPAELEARQEAIETQGLHAERDAWFKRLEAGDEEAIKTWQRFRNLTIEQYRTLYSRLAIEFDEYAGESQVSATSIAAAEAALKDKGLYEDNHGAGTIDYRKHGGTKGMGTGTLRFRAGTTTYLLRDIGALLDRAEQHGFDKMIYVVAAEQDTHFQRLFKAVELMGRSDIASKVQHVHFGKTQEPHPREQEDGNPPMQLLDDILRQAETAAGELLKVDHRGAALLLVDGAAGKVAAGALIVQSLHCKRDGQLSIDLTRAMTFDGETGPYLQYWHGRLCRLLDGAAGPAAVSYSAIDGDVHGDLLRVLARFPDTIQAAFKTLEPGALLTSLFQLVDEASALLGGDGEEAPAMTTGGDVAVYAAVRQVLENGLRVLGIPTLSV
ncbi:cytochrome b5 [Purpureocillium lavendulum]|uniref:arginine--tRNA ligase n=1 Tax=Purpureocillium lavendulum TaxID=1247861 RepID=A0AB34FW13_9HYPO|nr:cytochrome b5 [Purpureocillium lavendulum]